MNAFENSKVVNVPLKLLKDKRLSDRDLVVLLKILSYNVDKVSIVALDNDFQIKKGDIVPLVEKNILSVSTHYSDILVDLNPLFENQVTNVTPVVNETYSNPLFNEPSTFVEQVPTFSEPVPSFQPIQEEVFDFEFITRVQIIWNKKLNDSEIDKVKEWLKMGISKEDIEHALQKAIFNDAHNFAYVEAILTNNQTRRNSAHTVTRNAEFY